jgi:hypothetical protein
VLYRVVWAGAAGQHQGPMLARLFEEAERDGYSYVSVVPVGTGTHVVFRRRGEPPAEVDDGGTRDAGG